MLPAAQLHARQCSPNKATRSIAPRGSTGEPIAIVRSGADRLGFDKPAAK
jgi:hypothetical protein